MQQPGVSKQVLLASAGVLVLVLALLFWWRTQPRTDGAAYSESISRLESSPEFQAQQDAKDKARKEGKRAVDPTIPADKVFQPEDR